MFDSVDARLQPKEPANRTRHLKVHTAHNTWLRLVYVNVHCGIVAVFVFLLYFYYYYYSSVFAINVARFIELIWRCFFSLFHWTFFHTFIFVY